MKNTIETQNAENRELGKKSPSPRTFRPNAATLALWPQIVSAHPTKNASQIINDAIQLHGAEATRLFLNAEKAKIEATLAMLATRSTGKQATSPMGRRIAVEQAKHLKIEIPMDGPAARIALSPNGKDPMGQTRFTALKRKLGLTNRRYVLVSELRRFLNENPGFSETEVYPRKP